MKIFKKWIRLYELYKTKRYELSMCRYYPNYEDYSNGTKYHKWNRRKLATHKAITKIKQL